MNKGIRNTVASLAVIVVGIFALQFWLYSRDQVLNDDQLKSMNAVMFASPRNIQPFQLQDQDGQTFVANDFRGHWSIINFGYTNCPDICPTNMMLLGQVARQLEEQQKPMPQVYMVTVDPARDTPELLKGYVSYFNPEFKALSGDESVIASLARQLNNLFSRAPGGDDDVYFVDHSDNMAILNPEGQFVGIFRPPHKLSDLTTVLADLMAR
ncbi:SCO family protein [Gynuella sunshinyii]|uniref:Uncharacterized protein SCO1/SenC/PrrC, involved in biogenesis of respiratory and photosynthetic system n=1 Tax=Gynuella sunshinyii YC6258 TaxID=1445510 RepID=A0A0C5VHI5_9GAMM|nr:SCO family protein [Gynuella sunshinyii]AJQ92783.1 uncharacterized protein SCO1/SenC/PrrC, involved in biogenesis of respiratory and photosynthetic system [Gynuella sunshinyii YC6258]